MADALVAPFADALRTGALVDGSDGGQRLAKHRGQPAELHVTVAASTLLGLDEAPAMLRGYGPITPDVVRELAPDSRMRRILTDPRSGAVLDVGTTVYKPPARSAALRRGPRPVLHVPGLRVGRDEHRLRPHRAVPAGLDVGERTGIRRAGGITGSSTTRRCGSSATTAGRPVDDADRSRLRGRAAGSRSRSSTLPTNGSRHRHSQAGRHFACRCVAAVIASGRLSSAHGCEGRDGRGGGRRLRAALRAVVRAPGRPGVDAH